MEEKERYEVMISSLNGYAYIHDFITDNVLNTYDSCDLLNQQSKRIKELEKENEQLKQQLEETKQNGNYQVMLMCSKENVLLKQQLHDLSKKIVGEIEKCFTEYLPLKDKTGAWFYGKLNEILKKYGGEDGRTNK